MKGRIEDVIKNRNQKIWKKLKETRRTKWETQIYLLGVSGGKDKMEKMQYWRNNDWELLKTHKDKNPQIHEVQEIPSRITVKIHSWHIIIQFQETRCKGMIFKRERQDKLLSKEWQLINSWLLTNNNGVQELVK